MNYDRNEITTAVRRILLAAQNKGAAQVQLMCFHSFLPKGVHWGEEAPKIHFEEDRRSVSFTLTCQPDDPSPMSINVHITVEELGQTG